MEKAKEFEDKNDSGIAALATSVIIIIIIAVIIIINIIIIYLWLSKSTNVVNWSSKEWERIFSRLTFLPYKMDIVNAEG